MTLNRTAMHNVAARHEHLAFLLRVFLQCISAVCHRGLEVFLVLPIKNPRNRERDGEREKMRENRKKERKREQASAQ